MRKILLLFCTLFFIANTTAQNTYILCGKLIDTESGKIKTEQTIVVNKNKIIDVMSGYVMPRDATSKTIDLRNKVVMPGLIDMHVHIEHEYLLSLVEKGEILRDKLAGFEHELQWSLALGVWVRSQPLFHRILHLTESGVVRWDDLLRLLARDNFSFREFGDLSERAHVLMAFLTLVAQSKELRSGRPFPLVPTQVHLWL